MFVESTGNQPLQKQIGGKATYQSPLLDPTKEVISCQKQEILCIILGKPTRINASILIKVYYIINSSLHAYV